MKLEIEQALSTWHTRIDVLCVVEDGWRVSCAGVASAESMQVLGEYKSPSHQREGAQALGYRPATGRVRPLATSLAWYGCAHLRTG